MESDVFPGRKSSGPNQHQFKPRTEAHQLKTACPVLGNNWIGNDGEEDLRLLVGGDERAAKDLSFYRRVFHIDGQAIEVLGASSGRVRRAEHNAVGVDGEAIHDRERLGEHNRP